MSLNDTPSGERIHIGFFGRRNAGKSSVVNAVTGQELAGILENFVSARQSRYLTVQILQYLLLMLQKE